MRHKFGPIGPRHPSLYLSQLVLQRNIKEGRLCGGVEVKTWGRFTFRGLRTCWHTARPQIHPALEVQYSRKVICG